MTRHLFLKRWFLQGAVVITPFALTATLLYLVVGKTDEILGIIWKWALPSYTKPSFPGIGLLLVITVLITVGATTESWIIRHAISWFNWCLSKVPLIRSIYTTILKIVEAFANSHNTLTNAVLIEYPRKDCYSIAFLTSESCDKLKLATKQNDLVNVFLPTTPNPTSGFYLAIPKHQIISTSMGAEEAFKLVISAGIVQEKT